MVAQRKNHPYRDGELEVILSLVPTRKNVSYLARLLARSEDAVEIVYRMAQEPGAFAAGATSQQRKILEAAESVGLLVGRRAS